MQLGVLLMTMSCPRRTSGRSTPGRLLLARKKQPQAEICGGGHYNTRGWMKNALNDVPTQEDRQNLEAKYLKGPVSLIRTAIILFENDLKTNGIKLFDAVQGNHKKKRLALEKVILRHQEFLVAGTSLFSASPFAPSRFSTSPFNPPRSPFTTPAFLSILTFT